MTGTIHAFDFLKEKPEKVPLGICAVFGSERFLKQLAVKHLVQSMSDAEDPEYGATFFDSASVDWPDVHDELSTRSLFGGSGPRIVVIDHADDFVKKHREHLEDWLNPPPPKIKAPPKSKAKKNVSVEAVEVEAPAKQKPAANVEFTSLLILIVDSWVSTTRLYKEVEKQCFQIKCDPPLAGRSKNRDDKKVVDWLRHRANKEYQYKLSAGGAQLVIDLTDSEFGRMDQELQKLALYLDAKGELSNEIIQQAVGGWKTQTTWDAIDAATEGDTGKALDLLDHLLRGGEHPLALFGQISSTLRRFSNATEIVYRQVRNGERPDMAGAVKAAGFPFWGGELGANERRLKQVGSKRASQISQWLLEADLALKRSHSKEEMGRLVLEKLLVRLSRDLGQSR